ncbi:UPF0739 protein C1orf74 homolog [Diadema antillarum]|uniref:UPF0739 protein C1orf74 homolog n=1 Tax=Diadema antillarum TaxID=105358 RepID=UPI003A8A3A75
MNLQSATRSYLGRAASKHWKEIVCDISSVIGGVKPAFLYDYPPCKPESLQRFASDIVKPLCCVNVEKPSPLVQAQQSEVAEDSSVVQGTQYITLILHDDIIFVNRLLLLKNIRKFLTTLTPVNNVMDSDNYDTVDVSTCRTSQFSALLVDVTGALEKPKIASQEDISNFALAARDVVFQVERDSGDVVNLSCSEWNLTTVFGLLLGYPVLYWYEVDVHGNCLSYTPLCVHKCICNFTFESFPSIKNEHPSNTCIMQKKEHVVYSFSAPECLSSSLNEFHVNYCPPFYVGMLYMNAMHR